MKELIFLTESDLLFGSNNFLKSKFGVTKKDKENEYIPDLWYDCDYIKSYGEEGRGNTYFVTFESKTKFYVISMYELESEEKELIEWWYTGAENDLMVEPLQNTWDDWDKVQSGIAYRGGSGYCYSLYAKELK